ncbi:MAG TPA: hypothetical protein VK609_05755 [Mucilaginibacter sp.]|nr:hypothetical protein [Mucilaginibacter sp.]
MERIHQLLKSHDLKATRTRVALLSLLAAYPTALALSSIEKALSCDRMTLYRVIRKLESLCLLHRVLDQQGTSCFFLDAFHQRRPQLQNQPRHLHFSCKKCHTIYWLKESDHPVISLPDDFSASNVSMTIFGICPACNPV